MFALLLPAKPPAINVLPFVLLNHSPELLVFTSGLVPKYIPTPLFCVI